MKIIQQVGQVVGLLPFKADLFYAVHFCGVASPNINYSPNAVVHLQCVVPSLCHGCFSINRNFMEYTIKAIPTEYAGVKFRSRTEARWAAFFDLVELKWDYEPLDLEGWAPDFLLRTKIGAVLCEVKPVDLTAYVDTENRGGNDNDALAPYNKALAHARNHQILLLGMAPMEMQGASLPFGIHAVPPRGEEYSFDDMQDAITVGDAAFVADAWRKAGSITQWVTDEPTVSTSQIVSHALNRAHRKAEQKRAV